MAKGGIRDKTRRHFGGNREGIYFVRVKLCAFKLIYINVCACARKTSRRVRNKYTYCALWYGYSNIVINFNFNFRF